MGGEDAKVTRLLGWIMPLGPWKRRSGHRFLLDSIRWLWFGGDDIEPYEIDSMAYIFDSMAAR